MCKSAKTVPTRNTNIFDLSHPTTCLDVVMAATEYYPLRITPERVDNGKSIGESCPVNDTPVDGFARSFSKQKQLNLADYGKTMEKPSSMGLSA